MKLWSGRFSKRTDNLVDQYNASIHFDHRLAEVDIQGSLAHVEMLGHCNILNDIDVSKLKEGLKKLKEKYLKGALKFSMQDEDIHMNIERLLHEEIGEVAGKLHTGRSRNDQVAIDLHLYLRQEVISIIKKLYELLKTLHQLSEKYVDTIMPGYTHLQRAEPIRLGHYFMAYYSMFSRDVERLLDNFKRINVCPLGAGALAGSGMPIDRVFVAEKLRFESIYENSLDAVSDRDFVVEFLSNASLMMMHFSKISEELILWSSREFSFVELDDSFCTGSSMMPQKKNPDVCELARGKTGRVYGALMGLLTMLKGLPLAYNKDLQEDKEGLFDVIDQVSMTLDVFTPMLATMKINTENMQQAVKNDFAVATEVANFLVRNGESFRVAHEVTGKLVSYCIDRECFLHELTVDEFQKFHPSFSEEVLTLITPLNVIEQHACQGGTAKESLIMQSEWAKKNLTLIEKWIEQTKKFE